MLHAKRLIFFCLLSCSMSANAWWETAHMMVCDKAYELLTPSALEIVDPLIKVHESFGRSCLWADWIKAEDRIDTRSWHYINLPDSEQNIYTAKCPENGCLISSFHEQIEILKDESTSARQKQEALWFIGHFVGDIHQPMHVGYPEDRGGNDHLLEFVDGRKTNMHSLWDGQIIEHMESIHGQDYLSINVSKKINEFLNSDHSHEIESWGQESRNLAMKKSVGYRNNQLTTITNEYMEAHFDIVQERIALGAIRLSKTLNRLFSEQS